MDSEIVFFKERPDVRFMSRLLIIWLLYKTSLTFRTKISVDKPCNTIKANLFI